MLFFITNREIIPAQGTTPESIREDGRENASDNLRFGTFDLDSGKFQLFPEPGSITDTDYQMSAATDSQSLVGSTRFFKMIYDELVLHADDPNNDVLFFIHGFNTDLQGVRNDFRELARNYIGLDSPVRHIVIFTWPGRHPAVPYHYLDDKKDAIRSGEALARGVEKIIAFFKEFLVKAGNQPCRRKIHLMAHSMGHRVLKHMMLTLQANGTPYPEVFSEIVLMAADIEYNIFELTEPFHDLIDLGSRVHVYYHRQDRVLDISKYTKNFSNRLGRYGRKRVDPNQPDVVDVDVSSTSEDQEAGVEERLLNHWYYYTSSQVAEDVRRVLSSQPSQLRSIT